MFDNSRGWTSTFSKCWIMALDGLPTHSRVQVKVGLFSFMLGVAVVVSLVWCILMNVQEMHLTSWLHSCLVFGRYPAAGVFCKLSLGCLLTLVLVSLYYVCCDLDRSILSSWHHITLGYASKAILVETSSFFVFGSLILESQSGLMGWGGVLCCMLSRVCVCAGVQVCVCVCVCVCVPG